MVRKHSTRIHRIMHHVERGHHVVTPRKPFRRVGMSNGDAILQAGGAHAFDRAVHIRTVDVIADKP
jgi:hypothetical protein